MTTNMRWRMLYGAGVIAALAFFFLESLSAEKKPQYWLGSFAKYAEIPGATRVGPDACTACHKEITAGYRHALHPQQGIECEDCHGPASLHAPEGDTDKIIGFRSRRAEQSNGVCLSCHAQGETVRHWLSGSHAANHVRCSDCHQVHGQPPKGAELARLSFDTTGPGTAPSVQRLAPETNTKLAPPTSMATTNSISPPPTPPATASGR